MGDGSPATGVGSLRVAPVSDDQWDIVAWLWQAFRQDLALVVHGFPYADGRDATTELPTLRGPDGAGYLAWRPHPKTGEDAPVAFALVAGLEGGRHSFAGFWVAPPARRDGVGRVLALDVLARHETPWSIAFQHDNAGAGHFWRHVADAAFGSGRWSETRREVQSRADAPPDHVIESC